MPDSGPGGVGIPGGEIGLSPDGPDFEGTLTLGCQGVILRAVKNGDRAGKMGI